MSSHIGIDIGARSVEVVVRRNGGHTPAKTFQQTPQGHEALVGYVQSHHPQRVVLEATGVYYLDVAVALADAGLPVAVINPKSFHHFAALKLNATKTDAVDAALLAEFAERMQPALWAPPNDKRLQLRDIARQINRLIGARTQAKNRLHALQAKRATPRLLIDDEQQGVTALEQRIERLRTAAEELIDAADPALARHMQHLSAAKGIGTASALALLGELCVLPQHLKAPQVSRHAGLDVRLCQSGTSVQRPARLSKAGNAYLRAALYMPAMAAIRHDPNARAFYNALLARGKKKIQAICAVMRKYLTGLWACMKTDQPFDSAKLFGPQHHQKT
ncbi:IS110 family transposase [Aquisalimonas sp. APHAB1-3]|uniref:IS110 family transposase n=1 Tax=Aquisalimonas sp. APHAB1-3 TaxID=3402080 RepID=UPI003AADD9B7